LYGSAHVARKGSGITENIREETYYGPTRRSANSLGVAPTSLGEHWYEHYLASVLFKYRRENYRKTTGKMMRHGMCL